MIGSMVGRPNPNTSNRQIVNPYSIIAFFGFETDSAKAFCDRCLAWFYEHNVTRDFLLSPKG